MVIGAGHAGLAMSRCLTERSIDHVLLERGAVANSWRTERWDSLRLLTPNWQTRLPGHRYRGHDPDGYMTVPQVVDFLDTYAAAVDAPVETNTAVRSVRRHSDGFVVGTSEGDWRCRSVVVASGACNRAAVPDAAARLPGDIVSLTPLEYRRPDQLPDGGVLVAGGSATGIQLADEIHRSGRPVTLAVGGHVRVPRTYRGHDIMSWLDAVGILGERYDEVDDPERVRRLPSFQLVGSPERTTIDLNSLRALGVRVVGRVAGIADGTMQFSGSLRNQCALADLKLRRLLDTIDEWVDGCWLDGVPPPPPRPTPTVVDDDPLLTLRLGSGEIRSVIWATGYRPDLSWLHLPVFDRASRLRHDGGITDVPGLYLLGLPFLRRRKSTLIDGAGDDARELSAHLAATLAGASATHWTARGA
ncbi:MAG: NAD(P)-binding domain-containing protein [Acidimicrobiia bacterium]|nr:NAD(P)-binding domain-containing protein [Acidimicrobiia bacterium]